MVQASRFLKAQQDSAKGEPDEGWNEAVVALLNYPEALQRLDDDLDWTWRLGEAVQAQEEDVIAAVKAFRDTAHLAGNLESDDKQKVLVGDAGAIEIKPAVPDEIYVPYYEPAQVVVRQPVRVYHYYPQPYPVYYYPYHRTRHFSHGPFWGVTSAFSLGWGTGRLHWHHHGFHDHPYYGYSYYDPFYYRRPNLFITSRDDDRRRRKERHHDDNRWRPDDRRRGARPNANSRRHRNAGQQVAGNLVPAPTRPFIRSTSGPAAPQPPAQTTNPARIGVRTARPGGAKPGTIAYRPIGAVPLDADAARRPFPMGRGAGIGAGQTRAPAQPVAPTRPAPPRINAGRAPKATIPKPPIDRSLPGEPRISAPTSRPKAPALNRRQPQVRRPSITTPRKTSAARPLTGKAPPRNLWPAPSRSAARTAQPPRTAQQPIRPRMQQQPRVNQRVRTQPPVARRQPSASQRAQVQRPVAKPRLNVEKPPARQSNRRPPQAPRTKPRR